MAASERSLQIIISAQDRASAVFDRMSKRVENAQDRVRKALDRAVVPSAALAGSLAFGARSVLTASDELQNSLLGLGRVAEAMKQDVDGARQAAVDLASDGLLSVKDAAEGLKNLLATGFSLPESIRLMNAFRDSAAFNRQGTLAFGEAIVGATQGIKNQNSIMVDNAGITKNLSVILKEAGMSANDLGLVTSDVSVRTALYNGILQEASIFQGDAAEMAQTYSGRLSKLNTDIFNAKAALGDQLKPAMIAVLSITGQVVNKTDTLISLFKENKTAALILAGGIAGALVPSFYGLATAGSAAAVALAPFFITGAAITGMVKLIDMVSKRYTGYGLLDQIRSTTDLLEPKIRSVVQQFRDLQSLITQTQGRLNVFNQARDLIGLIDGKLLGEFAHGGVVPGSPNQAVPIIAHGGERIISRTGTDIHGGALQGVTINFNGDMSVRSDQDIQSLAQEISRVLGRQSELARIGVGR